MMFWKLVYELSCFTQNPYYNFYFACITVNSGNIARVSEWVRLHSNFTSFKSLQGESFNHKAKIEINSATWRLSVAVHD